jgi:hypothetical protein
MGLGVGPSGFKAFAVVRDKYGRIVVDEAVFRDPAKLEQLRQEVIKNGSDSRDCGPQRDR